MDVEFRVNQEHEYMANRIIEWRMGVGEQVLSQTGEVLSARWRFGDPIRLMMRWAKNGPDFPVFAGSSPDIKIENRTVAYRFENRWALLRLLRDYAGEPADFDKHKDPKPHTLRFAVDTRRLGVRPEEGGAFQTLAYIRVGLATPDKAHSVQVMPFFPDRAPALKRIAEQ
jgi:type VI secretion system protein ImpL